MPKTRQGNYDDCHYFKGQCFYRFLAFYPLTKCLKEKGYNFIKKLVKRCSLIC